MIIIENTENLAGVSIMGDFNDLYRLVEELHQIVIDESSVKHTEFYNISIRILGLCYDVRHAYQGDRELVMVDNNINEETMKYHAQISPKTNLYYKCNYYYPEMFFVMIALNELVKIRTKELLKSAYTYNEAYHKKTVWDMTIATIRSFQAEFANCVQKTISPAAFARWLGYMNSDFWDFHQISDQYIDYLNVDYLNLDREKRLKKLTSYAKRIAEFRQDDDHSQIAEIVRAAANKHNCPVEEIILTSAEYPDEITW